MTLPAADQDPTEKKKDDDKKKDKDDDDKKVGPIMKRLQELKAKREAEKEAKLKDELEKLQKRREERERKAGKDTDKAKEKSKDPDIEKREPEVAKPGIIKEWIDQSRSAYKSVKDYTCIFIKQERIGSKLMDEQTAEMSVRAEPFAVFFHFTGPKSVQGQEAAYMAGKNEGKARVKGAGLKGLVGYLTLAVDDPKIMSDNRHTIDQAGIGKLIEQIGDVDKKAGGVKSKILLSEVQFDKRDCLKLEITLEDKHPDIPYRSIIYFDKALKLPVRVENYEAPKKGKTEPELLEMYSYTQLKLNVGLKEEIFEK